MKWARIPNQPMYSRSVTRTVDPISTPEAVGLSAVIPTYRRETTLVETIRYLLALRPAAIEILVVDQTPQHEPETALVLERLDAEGSIRWIRLDRPSIPRAMNEGLRLASHEIVLFLDDDIIPSQGLVAAHLRAHAEGGHNIVAGQVLQPGEEPVAESSPGSSFRFCSGQSGFISELMGGNFSIERSLALKLGGFDENFVRVAYRFEAEFAARASAAGERYGSNPQPAFAI